MTPPNLPSAARRALLVSLLCGVASLVFAGSGAAQNLISNGDLESWPALTGTPPQGSPNNWNGNGTTIRSAGLVTGSTYSAVIQSGKPGLFPSSLAANPSQFAVGFVLAATDPGSTTARSFNLQITENNGASPVIGIRTVQGATPGTISFQAFNTTAGAWVPLSGTLGQNLPASVYNSTSNAFTTLTAYSVEVDVNFASATPSYSFSYGLAGSPMTTISGLTFFQTAPVANGTITNFGFAGNSSATNYGVDNVYLTAIPEANTVWAAGACVLLAAWKGRKMFRRSRVSGLYRLPCALSPR